jgi:5-oxopent-3-ene-1,2,5-tricarboxylate decarboxylase/2-hydroxyhepta-2,4-diene-1,7-dioate isomerase
MNPLPASPINTFLPSGTVYGTLLNFQREHALWAPRMNDAPYQGAPRAPVLYIKTANTFTPAGGAIALPPDLSPVEVSASLGLVMGWPVDALPGGGAPGVVAGVLLNDVAVAHDSYYRPPVKHRCVDGFLGVGPVCVPLAELGGLAGLAALSLELRVNGQLQQTVHLSELVRDPAALLAEVQGFMTLQAGDVLMLGTDCLSDGWRVRVQAGDTVEIRAPGFAPLLNRFTPEAA